MAKGYFPKELPLTFTTTDFGNHSEEILQEWEASNVFEIKTAKEFKKVNGIRFQGRYSYKKLTSAEPEIISKPKKLYERRNLHVTHPVPQALLAREIAANWNTLQKILSKRRYSEDQIVISDQYPRSIKGINFPLHRAKKSYIEATSDWLVRTDISRFYPTIYTHSIPWAAYGKERVKSSLHVYDGSFADRLDVLVRACNRNQTVGIPVGPETSRILAEIISSRIDSEFSIAAPNPSIKSADRLQDDWIVGSSTLEGAEKILSAISASYREYGLDINGSKTSVTHILASKMESWKSEISSFLSHRMGALHGSRLEEFLSLCLRLQLSEPSEPVLNYALSVVESRRFPRKDAQPLESFLLKAAAISPGSMDRICRIILNIEHGSGGLSRDRLASRFSELLEKHFSNGAIFEAIWILYTMRGLKKPFSASRIMDQVESVSSSAIRLLMLDMRDKGICTSRLPVQKWETEVSEERVLCDWTWLYAYEAMRRGWIGDPKGILSKPFFKPMHERNIVFYDPSKNVRNSKAVKREQAKLRNQQNVEAVALLSSLRGVDAWAEFEAAFY